MPQNMKKVHKCQIFKCIEDIMMNDANRMHGRHKHGFNLVNKIFIFIEKVPETFLFYFKKRKTLELSKVRENIFIKSLGVKHFNFYHLW